MGDSSSSESWNLAGSRMGLLLRVLPRDTPSDPPPLPRRLLGTPAHWPPRPGVPELASGEFAGDDVGGVRAGVAAGVEVRDVGVWVFQDQGLDVAVGVLGSELLDVGVRTLETELFDVGLVVSGSEPLAFGDLLSEPGVDAATVFDPQYRKAETLGVLEFELPDAKVAATAVLDAEP